MENVDDAHKGSHEGSHGSSRNIKRAMATTKRRGRGEGSVAKRTRKLPSGATVTDWVVRIHIGYGADGRRLRRWFCAPTKAAVLLKVEQEQARHGGAVPRLAPVSMTVAAYLESWLSNMMGARSPLTITAYRRRLELYAIPEIGKVRLASLDGERIAELYRNLRARGVSADNVQKTHKALRRAMNVAIGRGLITRNPTAHIERPRHSPEPGIALTIDQVRVFLAAIRGHRLEAMWWTATFGAMRPGELFALDVADLALDAARIDVRHNLEDDGGRQKLVGAKAHSERSVPIALDVVAVLRAHVAALPTGTTIAFPSPRGFRLRLGRVNPALAVVCAAAGLPRLTSHDLRHTGITLFARTGAHITVARDIAGHTTTDMTAGVYTHTSADMHRSAVIAVAAAVLRPGPDLS